MALSQQQQSFIYKYGPMASYASVQLGIPRDYVLGQWALETGWGQSVIGNNLGNISSGGQVNRYGSISEGVNAYINTMKQPRYASTLEAGKTAGLSVYATMLQKSGYATDPNYGSKVAATVKAIGGDSTAYNSIVAESNNVKTGVTDVFDKVTGYIADKGFNIAFIGVALVSIVGLIYFSIKSEGGN